MRKVLHYVLDGKTPRAAANYEEWRNWFNRGLCSRIVEQSVVDDSSRSGVFISTVFLGYDASREQDKSVLFETRVFGGRDDSFCQGYAEYDAAKSGHDDIVRLIEMSS